MKFELTAKTRQLILVGLVVLVGILLLSGCASDAPMDTLKPEGDFSRKIHSLVKAVFSVAGVIFVLVQGAILFIITKFRQLDGDDELPPQTHGNTPLEIGWTVLPAVILAAIAVPTVATVLALHEAPSDDFDDCITVVGHQWWWSYEYDMDCDGETDTPPDVVSANELVIPVDTQISLRLTSRDVIHSWWIPRLNGKRDAVPNMNVPWSIHADDEGTYFGQCTEFCGLSHGVMRMSVKVVSDDEYESWRTEQLAPAQAPSSDAAERGKEIFDSQCASCHTVRDSERSDYAAIEEWRAESPVPLVAGYAPDLTHFASRDWFLGGLEELYIDGDRDRFNRVALEQWLRDPESVKEMDAEPRQIDGYPVPVGRGMPNLNLSESQIDDLVSYLEGLE